MWIDKLAIYKYDREYSEGKKQKPLEMKNHLINDEMMKLCKLESLVNSLVSNILLIVPLYLYHMVQI